ncbi:MAG TPA: HAMP domain-containing sensor histidine kinase [Thermoleophilaceae bacterium]|jgi:two-component system sensor histidine kinase UhpB
MNPGKPFGGTNRRPSMFWRIFLPNAAVLMLAWALLAFSPAHVASPTVDPVEAAAGVAGLVIIFLVNVAMLRRALAPLDRLRSLMRTADPLRPGRRIPTYSDAAEVVELTEAFNEMLARLERERRDSSSRVLDALESERLRLSRELHDEIGQGLTALLLELENASRDVPPESAAAVHAARESARASLEEVRRVARQLRPEALDDLGLRSALTNLADRMSGAPGVEVARTIEPDLPPLGADEELALYRVAQEALTNAARHSGAARIELRLESRDGRVELSVRDDGVGAGGVQEGAGLIGMRERALMIGADLAVGPAPGGGFEVRLALRPREPA